MKTVYHLTQDDIAKAISMYLRTIGDAGDYHVEIEVKAVQKPPTGGHRGGMSDATVVHEVTAKAERIKDYLE